MAHPQADPLPAITDRLAQSTTVLFLDEFQVTDIADAMILRRLLTMLLARGMVLITTSNRHPRDLYRNGIQRESFIPAIEVLPPPKSTKNSFSNLVWELLIWIRRLIIERFRVLHLKYISRHWINMQKLPQTNGLNILEDYHLPKQSPLNLNYGEESNSPTNSRR
jgi:AFG1-like ATPase